MKDASKILNIAENHLDRISVLIDAETFINASIGEAAFGSGTSLFGRMRELAEKIDKRFEGLDPKGELKDPDTRVKPFIRSHWFITLISITESLLFEICEAYLIWYPEKIHDTEFKVKLIIGAKEIDDVLKKIARSYVEKISFWKPKDYLSEIIRITGFDSKDFTGRTKLFIEAKARRDCGVHNNWIKNEIYINKCKEIGVDPSQDEFLGVSNEYFSLQCSNCMKIIDEIHQEIRKEVDKQKAKRRRISERNGNGNP